MASQVLALSAPLDVIERTVRPTAAGWFRHFDHAASSHSVTRAVHRAFRSTCSNVGNGARPIRVVPANEQRQLDLVTGRPECRVKGVSTPGVGPALHIRGRPGSSHPRWIARERTPAAPGPDPKASFEFPQSCPTPRLRFSGFGSTKQPSVAYGRRPQADPPQALENLATEHRRMAGFWRAIRTPLRLDPASTCHWSRSPKAVAA